MLSTCWVGNEYEGNIERWRQLFNSDRPNKAIGLMKPSEMKVLASLPNKITVYRAQGANNQDGISFTTDINVAIKFAEMKKAKLILVGQVKKRSILALFTRRKEQEVVILDSSNIKWQPSLTVTSTAMIGENGVG